MRISLCAYRHWNIHCIFHIFKIYTDLLYNSNFIIYSPIVLRFLHFYIFGGTDKPSTYTWEKISLIKSKNLGRKLILGWIE